MTTANGIHAVDVANAPQPQLRKRKRSSSPQLDGELPLKQGWSEKVLKSIQEHDLGEDLLDYQLPSSRVKEVPASKRRRTQSANHATETIRTRIDNNTYQSLDQLIVDLEEVKKFVLMEVNGHGDSQSLDGASIDEIRDSILQEQQKQPNARDESNEGDDTSKATGKEQRPALQLLSLRGQTDAGVRQLFTGLPINRLDDSKDADTKRLPNGFEFIDSALMNAASAKGKDTRTFGEVFTSHRSLKPLDPPRTFRTQASQLDFVPVLSKLGSSNKHDYRATALSAGAWISYATSKSQNTGGDSAKSIDLENDASSLFKAAFSSFAPAVDHSTSVVTESDRGRKWFVQHALSVPLEEATPVATQHQQHDEEESGDDNNIELADNLDEIVQNYISEADVDGRDEGEKILEELNELIQSLSSYQVIRDLEQSRGPGSSSKLTQPEFDTYGMLQTQLQILISSLPPHAVAKLNGDQLDALNISTNVPVTIPEIIGTGQADNYTIRKQRAGQTANNPLGRGSIGAPVRPGYGTANPTYSAGSQGYGQSTSASVAYGARSVNNMYNTPRAGMPNQTPQYTQQPYRTSNTTYTTPGTQPYQQSAGVKYSQPYVPRATQPGYQQRAQERGSAWQRPDSPQKPLVNGQTPQPYQTRQFAVPTPGFANSPAQSNALMQQRLLEQMKQPQPVSPQQGVINSAAT